MPHFAHFSRSMLFAFKIVSLPIPTRPGTRTFLQVRDPSRLKVKNPYPSDPGQVLKHGSVHLPLMSGPGASGLKSACSFIPRRSALNELGGEIIDAVLKIKTSKI